ncbi:hypothetical protein GQ53DRAFT_651701 [Thozetella sp. PMI_491]|nr:hypothetical protein GQ53DRAFT_651701 [Thozetella sp. PMI_491]
MEKELRPKRRYLVDRLSFPALVAPLVLLAAATGYLLFLSSDPRVNVLFTPCLSPEPGQSGPFASAPVVGIPTCCLVSFFRAALSSRRSAAIMGVILSYVGSVYAALTVESARGANQSNWMIRNPTPAWLLFNLAGGAVVWQLAIVPSFLYQAKKCYTSPAAGSGTLTKRQATAYATGDSTLRHIPSSEVLAVSIAIAVGYVLPCIPFVDSPKPIWILIWLFFPLYVSAVRQLARRLVPSSTRRSSVHPEFEGTAFFTIYALPIVCSVVSHYALLYDMYFVEDDRAPTTRAALQFIQLDIAAIGLTVLYWIVAVNGLRIALLSVALGLIVGPGAGLCFAWVAKEWDIRSKTVGMALRPADKDK